MPCAERQSFKWSNNYKSATSSVQKRNWPHRTDKRTPFIKFAAKAKNTLSLKEQSTFGRRERNRNSKTDSSCNSSLGIV
eukprot:6211743-Pleurochrysis_carterae.AAC.3